MFQQTVETFFKVQHLTDVSFYPVTLSLSYLRPPEISRQFGSRTELFLLNIVENSLFRLVQDWGYKYRWAGAAIQFYLKKQTSEKWREKLER